MFKGFSRNKKLKKLRTNQHAAKVICTSLLSLSECDSVSSSDSSCDSDYELSDSDKCTSLKEECADQLRREGLDAHLASSFCNKSPSMVKTMIMRYVKFLMWLQVSFHIIPKVDLNVGYLLSTFIVEKSKLLPVYYQYLKEKVLLKPSTIIDVNENVQVLVHWFCVYRTQTSYSTDSSLLYNVNLIIKTMRKVFNKQRHVEEAKNTGMN